MWRWRSALGWSEAAELAESVRAVDREPWTVDGLAEASYFFVCFLGVKWFNYSHLYL
jgi:hypothetical protein